jgi:NAD(P)-dependent dehydrogenase (short-subunit alcohol dehydrogenase family)
MTTNQPQSNGRLAGKVCAITGATGIAEAAALRFAAEGARLFVVALREDDCRALAEHVGPDTELEWVAADLTDESDAERAFAVCANHYGRLDALLACAGGSGRPFGDGPLHSTSLQS